MQVHGSTEPLSAIIVNSPTTAVFVKSNEPKSASFNNKVDYLVSGGNFNSRDFV